MSLGSDPRYAAGVVASPEVRSRTCSSTRE
jgi:hypothetical protein